MCNKEEVELIVKNQNENLAEAITILSKNQDKMFRKVNEMHKFYTGAKFMQKAVLWLFATGGTIVAFLLGLRELFKD